MRTIARYGISARLPPGWEGAAFRRPAGLGERTHPVLHLASFPLPAIRGDFGSNAVEAMRAGDAFLALLEDDAASVGTAMFAGRTLPRALEPAQFSPAILQRSLPGQVGTQVFFAERGRAFCLYVVLGSGGLAQLVVPRVNAVLAGLRIEPR